MIIAYRYAIMVNPVRGDIVSVFSLVIPARGNFILQHRRDSLHHLAIF